MGGGGEKGQLLFSPLSFWSHWSIRNNLQGGATFLK
jgi:hypothetical protein